MTIAVPGSYTVSVTAAIAAVSSITLSDVGATLAIAAPGVTEAITAGLTNSGTVDVDATGTGGTSVTIEGTLSNSGVLAIGDTGLSKSTTVTAAAPATLTGTFDLSGDALLEFKSGGITALGTGANLTLNGAKSPVALSTALTTNSALTGLASNGGTLILENGASLTTTAGLTNNATVEIDEFNNGGSSLTVGGALTNGSFPDIGNSGITAATKVTAAWLSNTSTIELTGGSGTDTATLTLTGASSDGGGITVDGGGVLALGTP